MMMVYPESKALQGDDENNGGDDDNDGGEESGNACHSDVPSPLCKSSNSTDENQRADPGQPTIFLTPGGSYMVKDKQMGLAKHALELAKEDQEPQEPFYKDMGMSASLDGDKQPSPTYHLPGHQRLPVPQKAGTAPSGFQDSLQHSSGQPLGTEASATQAHASNHSVGHPESTTGAEPHMLRREDGKDSEDSKDRETLSQQAAYDSLCQENSMLRSDNEMFRNENFVLATENFTLRQAFKELRKDRAVFMAEDVVLREEYDVLGEEYNVLREEYNVLRQQYDRLGGENDALRKDNAMVRRMFQTFQNNLKRQVCMVACLQDQLKASQAKREREVQELQSLVQETECHLQIMTQRALNAETNMERLKQKIFILQGQLERCKLGNENLRTDWSRSSETDLRLHQAKPPRAHNGQRCFPQVVPASEMLPIVTEVLESTRKNLQF